MSDLTDRLSWSEIVEHCSRLHTKRTRKEPWADDEREDSQMLAISIAGQDATIVPTRMHEPGFYWRLEDGVPSTLRSEAGIALLRACVDAGMVTVR